MSVRYTPSIFDHLKAILALPFTVLAVIPFLIQYFAAIKSTELFNKMNIPFPKAIGILLLIIGLVFFVKAISLFMKIGKGTLAPWHPTKKLIVTSLYRHMRNPMIFGVVTILLAEAFIFQSSYIFIWAVLFFIINNIYFSVKEEPDLIKRFGEEYLIYRKNVPRWLPRIKGWRPEGNW